MSRRGRDNPVPPGCIVLDSEAFSRRLLGDSRFVKYEQWAKQENRNFALSILTPVEVRDGRIDLIRQSYILSRMFVLDATQDDMLSAQKLLGGKLAGHKYAIDALIAAMCMRIRAHAIITSDVDDMTKLLEGTGIAIVPV